MHLFEIMYKEHLSSDRNTAWGGDEQHPVSFPSEASGIFPASA